jgi:hypothetical protein
MDITIGTLAVVMKIKGVQGELTLTVIMSVLALISLTLLIWYFRGVERIEKF